MICLEPASGLNHRPADYELHNGPSLSRIWPVSYARCGNGQQIVRNTRNYPQPRYHLLLTATVLRHHAHADLCTRARHLVLLLSCLVGVMLGVMDSPRSRPRPFARSLD
jgi:hypothetical protein